MNEYNMAKLVERTIDVCRGADLPHLEPHLEGISYEDIHKMMFYTHRYLLMMQERYEGLKEFFHSKELMAASAESEKPDVKAVADSLIDEANNIFRPNW